MEDLLEVAMLLCFAAAWPVSILKAWRSRTAHGVSIMFMVILEAGYLFGMASKFAGDDVNYVLAFYVVNFTLVLINIAIVLRNRRLDAVSRIHRTLPQYCYKDKPDYTRLWKPTSF